MESKLIDFIPTAYNIFIKSPWLYKSGVILTLMFIGILTFYGHKMYKESLKYHDFIMPNIRIFVEKTYNERTLSFDIESISDVPVYINQIQIAIYDTQKKEKYLYLATKHGVVNPLKKGDALPFSFVLDNPKDMGFNFTKVINENEYMMQVYKVIVVVHYNKNNLQSIKEQRFEYVYNVNKNNEAINGIIKEFPNLSNDSKRILKNIPYEINQ